MGKPSRDKGARGELEFARVCRDHGYDVRRTAQYKGRNGGEPDVIGLRGIHVEVKRTEKFRENDAIDQAKRDAKIGLLPVVAHRRNNESWRITMEADVFFEIYREYESGLALKEMDEHADTRQRNASRIRLRRGQRHRRRQGAV